MKSGGMRERSKNEGREGTRLRLVIHKLLQRMASGEEKAEPGAVAGSARLERRGPARASSGHQHSIHQLLLQQQKRTTFNIG